MESQKIELTIIELCSEDAYGSWELWWSVSQGMAGQKKQDLMGVFIDSIDKLVHENKLTVSNHKFEGGYPKAVFERKRLEFELQHADSPDPDTFYWFEAIEEGRKEDFSFKR